MHSNFTDNEMACLTEDILQKSQKEARANDVYASLLQSYGFVDLSKCDGTEESFVGKAELSSEDYPDYYGGAYINRDGGLTIYVADKPEKCKSEIERVTQSDDFTLRHCQYSYRDMLKVKEEIQRHNFENPDSDICKNITSYGVSDMENLIFVEMEDLDPAKIALFKSKITDSPMIVFRHGEKVEFDTTLRAGEGIIAAGFGGSSNGFRANSGGVYGFIMSGHASSMNAGVSLRSNGAALGTVMGRAFSGSTDAAFVRANSNVTLSNVIMNAGASHSAQGTAAVNTRVYQSGIGTGLTHGYVLAVGVNFAHLTGLVRASYHRAGGDSGGIVFRVNGAQRPVLGNHIGGTGGNAYYGTIANIINALRAVPY